MELNYNDSNGALLFFTTKEGEREIEGVRLNSFPASGKKKVFRPRGSAARSVPPAPSLALLVWLARRVLF
jgi:hypothetical protein